MTEYTRQFIYVPFKSIHKELRNTHLIFTTTSCYRWFN